MMSVKTVVLAAALGAALTLGGCSAQKTEQTAKPEVTKEVAQNTASDAKEVKSLTIAEGTKNMRDTLKKMKDQLANKENDNAVKTSENLEVNWKKFEDNVKAKSPNLYDKIEDPLHTINAAVKVTPLDANTLSTAIDKLDATLAELQK